ncbi:MAG: Holliday junction resolvase RuvX [Gemmatimonadetes bacterium]|nr:Holliday junction resolvase RuvX [Gemmatimonadota bacterium]
MPRKNKPDNTLKEDRRRASRKRRHGAPPKQVDGIPGDLTHIVPVQGVGGRQPPEGRILGIDFGERRVGVAVSDPAGLIAQGLETIEVKNTSESLASIASIVEAEQVLEIVLGLPVNMDGTKGEIAEKVETFAGQLQNRVSCAVRTWDERMTSISARRAMNEMGMGTRGNKGSLDRIAATLLLQNYLDYRRGAADETESRD